jgi:hypothetical protein
MHADGRSVGLGTLSDQLRDLDSTWGHAVAAVNGDFYRPAGTYAGDPRGLQIMRQEVLSAPVRGSVAFWLGPRGVPRMGEVTSKFRVTWPGEKAMSFGLNSDRAPDKIVLYTPAVGASTRTRRGRELVLEANPGSPWLPLQIGEVYRARVREVVETGDTPIPSDTMVLSVGPAVVASLPSMEAGSQLELETGSNPEMHGTPVAMSGGPILVRGGEVQPFEVVDEDEYKFSSMRQRHPRTAFGWSAREYFMVSVDGRQRRSVGMTLEELGRYLVELGCEEAMNLDGGGSATLWCDGRVRNRPCDGQERPIANSLVVMEVPRD